MAAVNTLSINWICRMNYYSEFSTFSILQYKLLSSGFTYLKLFMKIFKNMQKDSRIVYSHLSFCFNNKTLHFLLYFLFIKINISNNSLMTSKAEFICKYSEISFVIMCQVSFVKFSFSFSSLPNWDSFKTILLVS